MKPAFLILAVTTATLTCTVKDSFAQNAATYWLANGNTTGTTQNPLNLGNWSSPSSVAAYQAFTSDIGGGGNFELRATRWASSVSFTRNDPNGVYNLMTLFSVSGSGTWMSIFNSTNQPAIVINAQGASYFNGGNLLIGKTSQSNSSYLLDVNGPARANQVVVNTSGADFVFDPGYHLPSLKELDVYVRREHHLPDIAPATQMQKEGMDLGGTQTHLLAKVEELTLYLIEQDKEIRKLKQENQELKDIKDRLARLEQYLANSAGQ